MTIEGGIGKLDAAQRQLDCAIRLWFVDEDNLAIHTLAYAACCLLRDLLEEQKREVLRKFEASQKFGEVPDFLTPTATRNTSYDSTRSNRSASLWHLRSASGRNMAARKPPTCLPSQR
jgi:hypothetical protein